MSQTDHDVKKFKPELIAVFRCPVTQSRLRLEGDWLIAEDGGLAYPIRDGIAVLVPEGARLPAGFGSVAAFKRAREEGDGDRLAGATSPR